MQVEAVLENQQRVVARIAGALAHELNNPLQGVLSLVGVTLRDCQMDQRCQTRMEQIHQGVTRLSRTVESLAAIYENLPRSPDLVPLADLLKSLSESLAGGAFRVQIHPPRNGSRVHCFAPELVRLAGDLIVEHLPAGGAVNLSEGHSNGMTGLLCELDSPPSGATAADEWLTLNDASDVSGLVVLLDELIRLSNGTAEFKWHDSRLSGMRLWFRSA